MASPRRLAAALVYCAALFGWHLLCSKVYPIPASERQPPHHEPRPTGATALREDNSLRSAAVEDSLHSAAVKDSLHSAAVEDSLHSAAVKDSLHSAAVEDSLHSAAVKDSLHSAAVEDRLRSAAVKDSLRASAGEHSLRASAVETSAPPSVATPRPRTPGASPACPARRPIHCLLTAQATVYQQWQARIMYFHWKKQARLAGECTEMTGFTRLVASKDGAPDGLEGEMPSVFVKQLTPEELSTLGHFGVLNRPYSVVQFIAGGHLDRIPENFVYIAETDHVFMRPLQNLAKEDVPVAFGFSYMHCGPNHQQIITKHSPGTSWSDVQNVGPSPVIISKSQLRAVAIPWNNLSLSLKRDRKADNRFGWVLEMWGYSIAAASLKIKHLVLPQFQIEGGAGISAPKDRYIFHYTYGIEYSMSGKFQSGQIGEWSLDKRHYGTSYPPRNLQPPPDAASDGAKWLLQAFNEATEGIASWPDTKALGTVGWRRVAGSGIRGSEIGRKLIGTSWLWAGVPGLKFFEDGKLKTPWGEGVWGVLPSNADYRDDGFCQPGCAFVDFSGALHNTRFNFSTQPPTFTTFRIGDGESIAGKQVTDT